MAKLHFRKVYQHFNGSKVNIAFTLNNFNMNKDSLKWQKLLWAVVIVGLVYFFFSLNFNSAHSKLGYSFTLFAVFVIIWLFSLAVSPIVLILRARRMIKNRESFTYIFVGVANLFLATIGLVEVLRSETSNLILPIIMLFVNLLIAVYILYDVFIKEIPPISKYK